MMMAQTFSYYDDEMDVEPHASKEDEIGWAPFTGVSSEDQTAPESPQKSKAVVAAEGLNGVQTKRASLFSGPRD